MKKGVAFLIFYDTFIHMTKTFTLINEEEKSREVIQLNPQTSSQDALLHLGFMVFPFDDSGEVKEYSLIDNDCTVFTFFSFFYENACFEALDRLGYSLYEGEIAFEEERFEELEEVQKSFNIIQFSLGV